MRKGIITTHFVNCQQRFCAKGKSGFGYDGQNPG